MFVLALSIELHINESRSLKAKRQVVKSIVETARHRFSVSAAEVGHLDVWQRSRLGFACVGADTSHVEEVIDAVERFVWSHPEVEVLETSRRWLDADE